ncbi:hypothetical protein PENSPDRAFT_541057, partial [Peniophora sp. CONT]
PKYSLANNLWLGGIPWDLKCLTFAESILVSLLYPRVHVFKLFPKVRTPGMDESSFQCAMCGSITTYLLNINDISSMIQGNLMPRPTRILVSVILITFIGLAGLPKNWIDRLFRVCRCSIHAALVWQKRHNPRYFRDVEIDQERIEVLPEDG